MALGSFFSRLKEGLSRSTQKLSGGITAVFKKRRLDDEALEELEELLISADLGTEAARKVIAAFRRTRFGKEVTDQEIKDALEEVSLREVPRLQKRTHWLGLLANLCTLVGLLGTIFGLQEAFAALESADPSQKSKLLARGITLALNATALGLMSAMVCMAAFTWLGSKSNQLLEQIDETVLRMVNFMNAQRKTGIRPTGPSVPGQPG